MGQTANHPKIINPLDFFKFIQKLDSLEGICFK